MITPPETDRAVGMERYATSTAPCQGRLKVFPEDFRVDEVMDKMTILQERVDGGVPLYRVVKRGIDTMHLERELGAALKSRVVTAGMKDKFAVATQFATPTSGRSEAPSMVEREHFSATLVGFLPKPLSRSALAGNAFEITLRDCSPGIEEGIGETLDFGKRSLLPNFFGHQRFGGGHALTNAVGKAMVRKEFKKAVDIILVGTEHGEGRAGELRHAVAGRNFSLASSLLGPGQDVERMVLARMTSTSRGPTDWLRAVPLKLRRLYVQAYQSYLFNRTLSVVMAKGLDMSTAMTGDNWGEVSEGGLALTRVHGVKEPMTTRVVPLVQLVGYSYRNYGSRFDTCVEEVLESEEVSPRDFFIKEMQEVSAEGGFRRPSIPLGDSSVGPVGETTALSFTLGKGSYATVLLREVVKPTDPIHAGFT